MKISIITPDLSGNCLGRAYLLAKILQRQYQVEIVGRASTGCVWEPVSGDCINYKIINDSSLFQLTKELIGDIIYCSKPLFSSYGIGLLKKVRDKKPLILDIDDWEMGFVKEKNKERNILQRIEYLFHSTLNPLVMGTYWNNLISEKLSFLANEITVSNTFLKNKFGGTIIWHARDTDLFNPEKYNKNLLREKYGIKIKEKIAIFFGTPRSHKGLDDLISAISLIKDVSLLVVGLTRNDYSQQIISFAKNKLKKRFYPFSIQPFDKVPELLTISDLVVIPQKENFATIGQMPAKVFDAMAMAKPVVATSVCDLPKVLEGCGWIVKPDNPQMLAESIQEVFEDPHKAMEMGFKARQKCIQNYSYDAMEKILIPIFKKYT